MSGKPSRKNIRMNKHRQGGATFLGMLIIVAILGSALYGIIRLMPIYMEYMAVVRAMDQIASQGDASALTPAEIRRSLDNRWTIEDIKSLEVKDVRITKVGEGFEMNAAYRAEAPFIANVSLVVDFDKTVVIR